MSITIDLTFNQSDQLLGYATGNNIDVT